jgi:phage protein D
MPQISYALLVDGNPVDPEVLAAVRQVDVEDHADLADIMRLAIGIGVREDGAGWAVLDDDLFGRLRRLTVTVAVGSGQAETLLHAHVVETRIDLSSQPGHSVLRVVALDPSVLMHLEEKVRAWPDMTDADIASAVFGEYGFTPKVESTQPTRQDDDATTVQRGSDIQFLRRLAGRNGCECYVEVQPVSGTIEGHFHPPKVDATPQPALSVNLGSATNVDAFAARFDMLRPVTVEGGSLDAEDEDEQQVQVDRATLRALGKVAAGPEDRRRKILLTGTGLSQAGELQTYAQAVADESAWALTAEGELDTAAYGGVLRAKRPVLVRGAGQRFSGTWYVERVLHTFTADGYTQRFTLRRNALGVTGQERFVDAGSGAA